MNAPRSLQDSPPRVSSHKRPNVTERLSQDPIKARPPVQETVNTQREVGREEEKESLRFPATRLFRAGDCQKKSLDGAITCKKPCVVTSVSLVTLSEETDRTRYYRAVNALVLRPAALRGRLRRRGETKNRN